MRIQDVEQRQTKQKPSSIIYEAYLFDVMNVITIPKHS
jgi:hypothetical protein